LPSQSFQPFLPTLRIAIFKKPGIMLVGRLDLSGMLDRAPVLLGSGGYFPSVSHQTITMILHIEIVRAAEAALGKICWFRRPAPDSGYAVPFPAWVAGP